MAIPYVGKCFTTAAEFLAYLDDIKFGAWRPRCSYPSNNQRIDHGMDV